MLQNTFHFVCRHYEGSYSEISVIRFLMPVCFASGLLQFRCFGHCGFRRQGWSGVSTTTRTVFAELTGSGSAAFQCRFGYYCPPSTALAVRVYYQLKVMDTQHRQQLQVFLKELDTADTFFQLAAQERCYTEQALVRLLRQVHEDAKYEPAADAVLPPCLGGPASTKQYRARQGQQRLDAVRVAALNALCVSGQRHEGSESDQVGVALPKRTAAEATVENAAKFQGGRDAMLAPKVNKVPMGKPQHRRQRGERIRGRRKKKGDK